VCRTPGQGTQGSPYRCDDGRESQIVGHPLASLEPVKTGEPVTQDQAQPYPRHLPERDQGLGHKGYEDCPSHIQQQNRHGPPDAGLSIDIGGTGIAAAVTTRVFAAGEAKRQNRKINRTRRIGSGKQQNECRQTGHDRPSTVSMVNRWPSMVA